ncbi:MAG: hypothetical protein IPM47_18735 [Sphingobacteriales bacterium]|nr:MAG: hypothetical protein IPM47_18735 [Sphingobacteriales bacterium]
MVTETCHPDNDLQLITDVHTATNNTDDTQLLHERLDSIKEKHPTWNNCTTMAALAAKTTILNSMNWVSRLFKPPLKAVARHPPSLLPSNPIPTRIGYNVPIHNTPK